LAAVTQSSEALQYADRSLQCDREFAAALLAAKHL